MWNQETVVLLVYRVGEEVRSTQGGTMWNQKTVVMPREELHALVWSMSMRDAAAKVGISDVGLKKACARHGIPVPARGHWVTPEAKRQPKTPLPEVLQPRPVVLTIQPKRPELPLPDELRERVVSEADPDRKIVVPDALRQPHPSTEATRRALQAAESGEDARVAPRDAAAFRVRVSKTAIARGLRIVDALLKACAARGIDTRPSGRDAKVPGLVLVVDGEAVLPFIHERVTRTAHEPTAAEIARQRRGYVYIPPWDYHPTGDLTLELDVPEGLRYTDGSAIRHRWSDGARRTVEDVLNEVIASLHRLAAWQRQRRLEREERDRRRIEEERLRLERQRRAEAEAKQLAKLEAEAERWQRAQRIRAYADAVEANAAAGGPANRNGETATRLRWAREQADRLDPLTKDI